MGTIPGTDNGFAQIKVPVEFDMENRCAETPDVLCDFAIHLCNIPANSLGPFLKHAIIHVCRRKLKISHQNF